MAQALPYVGAAIGSFFGPMGTQVGFMLGSIAQGVVDPQRIEGPRMNDLRVQSSSYGRALPALFGDQRIAGNFIWAKPLKEVKHEERAGKGGPVTTTYSYFANAAIAICEGPISGIRRIWADGKIMYDSSVTSTTVSPGGSSPLGHLIEAVIHDAAPSVPAELQPFECISPTFSSDLDRTDLPYLNMMWDLMYPPGTIFKGETEVGIALNLFWRRMEGGGGGLYGAYVYNYVGSNEMVVTGMDRTGSYNDYVATFKANSTSIPTCHAGYVFNAATNMCDPIFPHSTDDTTYQLMVGTTPKFAPGSTTTTTLVLTPNITVYLGTEDQMPDPNMESTLGVNNVPAYRGTAYVVLNDLPVDAYGNRMPNLEFEVVSKGSTEDVQQLVSGVTLPGTTGSAYDPARGNLWSFCVGTGEAPDYTRLNVDSSSKVAGTMSSAAPGAFKSLGLARYTAGTDSLWVAGTVAGQTCFAMISPDSGVILKVVSPSLALPTTLGGFCIDTTHNEIWTVGRADDGRLLVHAVALANGTATLVQEKDEASTNALSAVNGNVNAIEYSEKTDVVWLGYKVLANSNSRVTYRLETFDATTRVNLLDAPAPGQPWFLVEPASGDMWWYDGLRLNRNDRSLGHDTLVTSAPLAGAAADGSGNVGVVIKDANASVATFDSAGAFTGKIVKSADGLFAGGPNVFADHSRGLLVSSGGYMLVNRFGTGIVTVGDIFLDVARRLKFPLQNIDVSDVSGLDCRVQGFGILNRVSARGALEPLTSAYGLDVVDTGSKIRVGRRANAPYYGIVSRSDQGVHEYTDGSDSITPLSSTRANDLELPRVIEVSFDNPALEYRKDVRSAMRNAVASTVDARTVAMPMVMAAERAKAIADMLLAATWQGRSSCELTVGIKHIAIVPGDVVDVENDSGGLDRVIINRVALSPNGTIRLSGTGFDYSAYQAGTSVPAVAEVVSRPVASNRPPRLLLLDSPLLVSTDDSSGFYAAALPPAGQETFPHSSIFTSTDGANYSLLAAADAPATAGVVRDALPAGSPDVWDMENTLTVNLFAGHLYSAADFDVLNGQNLALVGREVVQFANATQNEDGSYTLSKLLRGRKGTEWAMTHSSGETFVLLNSAIQRIQLPIELTGIARFYKIVGPGQPLETAPAQAFINTDEGLLPYAPVKLNAARTNGDLSITWVRRTRVGGDMRDRVDVPLSEASEAYDVEVWGVDGQVVRTARVITPAYSYTSEQQQADFGSAQSAVHVNIYQISATVGRGFALSGTV